MIRTTGHKVDRVLRLTQRRLRMPPHSSDTITMSCEVKLGTVSKRGDGEKR
jgi:hypothetical protein